MQERVRWLRQWWEIWRDDNCDLAWIESRIVWIFSEHRDDFSLLELLCASGALVGYG